MATKIATNFSYKAEKFLDDRSNIAKTEADLLSWNIPVPEGYELALGDTWYYYDSTKTLPLTGHWIPRVVESLSDTSGDNRSVSTGIVRGIDTSLTNTIRRVKILENQLDPYKISNVVMNGISGTSLIKDLGDTFTNPEVIWVVKRSQGQDQTPLSSKVYSSSGMEVGTVGTDKLSWQLGSNLVNTGTPQTITYTINSKIDEDISASTKISYSFQYRYYYGSASIDLWNKSSVTVSELTGFGSSYTTVGTFPEHGFNCTGGLYPYIFIPKTYYNPNYKTYVSKNLNSDFVVKEMTVGGYLYMVYRTTYIQTGNPIAIEIKTS